VTTTAPLDRFMAKVERPDTRNSCWRWTAGLAGGGYGQFWIYEARHAIPAHRAAWLLMVGPIPPGLMVLHRCDVRECVNPEHLFLGTAADNTHDMMAKGRAAFRAAQSHCGKGHPMSGENLRIVAGKRGCRECRRIDDRERKRRYLLDPEYRRRHAAREYARRHLSPEHRRMAIDKLGERFAGVVFAEAAP